MPDVLAPVVVAPRAADERIHRASAPVVGTIVSIDIVCPAGDDDEVRARHAAVSRAIGWFEEVERVCSRFNPDSDLMRLSQHIGHPIETGPLLFEAVRFALAVAEDTGGAFDPTLGLEMESRGYNREHRSGLATRTPLAPGIAASFRDVALDEARRTITLRVPLVLDLGAVAKGLAVDMAVRELAPFRDFAIDAGGDLYLGGEHPGGHPWQVGIRDPWSGGEPIATLPTSNRAVCTSGNYEPRAGALAPHIVTPRGIAGQADVVSATVVAESAMLADALATAAFVLGAVEGLALLERHGVDGLLLTADRRHFATPGLARELHGR